MSVRDTSRAAYRDLRNGWKLGKQARVIVEMIDSFGGDWSLQEISRATGMPINAVSGRANDCKKAGALQEGPKRKCRVTGRTIHPVRRPLGQLPLFSRVA